MSDFLEGVELKARALNVTKLAPLIQITVVTYYLWPVGQSVVITYRVLSQRAHVKRFPTAPHTKTRAQCVLS